MSGKTFWLSLFLIWSLTSTLYAGVNFDGSGRSGSDGMNGVNGSWYGDSGTSGIDGGNGSSAKGINIIVEDQDGNLVINGTVGQNTVHQSVQAHGQIIQLSARGGHGGDGGNGGNGYQGRDGNNGLDGHDGRMGPRGRDGRDGSRYSPNGENGTDGGRGSDGENGTDGQDGTSGGNGGNGGDGGHGGDGASIVVKYKDPAVLMHISAYYQGGAGGSAGSYGEGGRKGIGGRGGDGGDGGRGGYGGNGGRGYRCTEQERQTGCYDGQDGRDGSQGWSGSDGRDGRRGSDGYPGSNGTSGSRGYAGQSGSLTYMMLDQNNVPIPGSESNEIYSPVVKNFNIVDENEDSIYEPGEKIFISNISIKNITKMNLPAGAIVTIKAKNLVGEVSYTLPEIKGNSEYVIKDVFQLSIPENLTIGSNFEIESNIEFRGLDFSNDHYSKKFKLLRPIVINKVEIKKYIPFIKPQVGRIEITNISTKAHDKIEISYVNEGSFDFRVTGDIGMIPAGTTVNETFEVIAPTLLDSYSESNIVYSLSRGGVKYAAGAFQNQVVPSYVPNNSDILIVSNGHNIESYKAMKAGLADLKLSFDIFDINLEGNLSSELMDKYHNKVILLANFENNFISQLESSFNEYLKTSGGVFTIGLNRSLKPTHYNNRFLDKNVDYFKLSFEEMVESIKEGVKEVLSFDKKQELLSHFFLSGEGDRQLYQLYKEAYLKDIRTEYLLFKDDGDIYDGNPYIDRYQKYVLNLSPITHYDLRLEMIKMVETLLKFDETNHLKFVSFKKHFKKVEDFYDNLNDLIEKCGEIKGVYQDDENNIIQIYKYSMFGPLRAETKDLKFEFRNGKEAEKNIWKFTYHVQPSRDEYKARFNLSCENGKTTLEGIKEYDAGKPWKLVKIYSKRMWQSQVE